LKLASLATTDQAMLGLPDWEGFMVSHEEICSAVNEVAHGYSLAKVSYFGSYAEGQATETSDLDLLVEFVRPSVSILKIVGLKQDLEELLNIPVDVIHAPIPKDSFLEIGKTIVAYEN
jgi:predicted nucleotidyltransferase